MNKKEYIKGIHKLYIENLQTWMTNCFEERGIEVEEQSEAQEKAMLQAILKYDNYDSEYLEWAAQNIELFGSTFKEYLEHLTRLQKCGAFGLLTRKWSDRYDVEIKDEIFNCYRKYFTTAIATEIKNALGK